MVSFIFSLIIEYPFSSLEQVLHNYILSAKYSRKVKLYSVTQNSDLSSDISTSDREDLHKNSEKIDAVEKYNKLKPFAHISDIQYMFHKVSPNHDTSKFVYNYKL
jgi:hypothetical protein